MPRGPDSSDTESNFLRTFTDGSPWRSIVTFAIPLLIGNAVQQGYHFVDGLVVGRTLGVSSLAAVGATSALIFMVLGFAWGMCSGFAIPTARAYGAGDLSAVRRSIATGTMLIGIGSVALTIAGPLLARPVLALMNTPASLLDESVTFTQVSMLGAASLMYFNYLAAVIRAIGDSRTPLVFLVISCIINAGLVVLFVGPIGLGVGGAALATVLSQGLSVALCLLHVRRRLPVIHLHREDWKVRRAEVLEQLRIGLPMGFQATIISLGSLSVQIRLNELGESAVAAWTTAGRIDLLFVMMLNSLGLAVSVYVAQNHGAGRPDRILTGVKQSLGVALGTAIALGVLIVTTQSLIVRLFIGDGSDEVAAMAGMVLTINAACYCVLAVLFVLRGALQGLGYTLVPTIAGFAELAMRLVTAIVLGAAFGFAGVVWGTPLAWLGSTLVLVPSSVIAFRRLRVALVKDEHAVEAAISSQGRTAQTPVT